MVFSRSPEPPTGPDGNRLITSVCHEIDESVRKAASIEKQLQYAKVISNPILHLLSKILKL